MIIEYERYQYAQRLFDQRRYAQAARELEDVLSSGEGYGRGEARQLHMRALFHSAQLSKSEEAARAILADDPTDAYAMVVLGRTLHRMGRADEAETCRRQAEAFGVETW